MFLPRFLDHRHRHLWPKNLKRTWIQTTLFYLTLINLCPNIFQQHLLVDFLAKFLTCQFQIPRIISIQRELYPVRTSIMNEKIVLWKGANIWRVHSMYYVCKLHPTWWSRYNVWVVSEILPWDQKKELQTKTYQIWYFSKPIVFKRQSRKAR